MLRGDKHKKDNLSAFGRELVPALRKSAYVLVALILLTITYLVGSWHGQKNGANGGAAGKRMILYYVDPMNPSHTSPEPGFAPCGMKLEPVYADQDGQAPGSSMPPGTVKISPERQQILGVRVAKVGKAPFTHTLSVLGKVAIDETRVYRLISFAEGWILKVYNNSTGCLVQKDEILASYYSRDFITAEQAYFYALNTMDRLKQGDQLIADQDILTSTQIRSAEENLQSMGMGKLQIKEIAQTRKLATEIYLRAPAASFVTFRDVTPGQKISRGTELYRLADLSRVWVLADLFENEAQYVKAGEKVEVIYPYQKKTFQATVSEVLPTFDPATRTLKVRLEVDNPGYMLRPDMFVDVRLPVQVPPAVTVPVDAVLDSGLKKTVFVDRGAASSSPAMWRPAGVWATGWRLSKDWPLANA